MQLLKYIAAVIAAAPMMAFAASQINAEQVTCSGTQTTDTTNGLQIDCVGSLTIVGGSLTSDEDIKLTASDTLYLDAISVTTPKNISLMGNGVSLGNNAKLYGDQVFLNASTNIVNNGAICGDSSAGAVISISGLPTAVSNVVPACHLTVNPPLVLVNLNAGGFSNNNACQPTGNPSVFKMIEVGTRYCGSGKTQFHQVRFLRAMAECHALPSTVELAPTQDFPMDSSTIQRTAQCNNAGGSLSSCLLYDAVDGSSTPIQQPSVGRLEIKWAKNGDVRKLEARIIEKTSDDCHSESTLKFVKGKK